MVLNYARIQMFQFTIQKYVKAYVNEHEEVALTAAAGCIATNAISNEFKWNTMEVVVREMWRYQDRQTSIALALSIQHNIFVNIMFVHMCVSLREMYHCGTNFHRLLYSSLGDCFHSCPNLQFWFLNNAVIQAPATIFRMNFIEARALVCTYLRSIWLEVPIWNACDKSQDTINQNEVRETELIDCDYEQRCKKKLSNSYLDHFCFVSLKNAYLFVLVGILHRLLSIWGEEDDLWKFSVSIESMNSVPCESYWSNLNLFGAHKYDPIQFKAGINKSMYSIYFHWMDVRQALCAECMRLLEDLTFVAVAAVLT